MKNRDEQHSILCDDIRNIAHVATDYVRIYKELYDMDEP